MTIPTPGNRTVLVSPCISHEAKCSASEEVDFLDIWCKNNFNKFLGTVREKRWSDFLQ